MKNRIDKKPEAAEMYINLINDIEPFIEKCSKIFQEGFDKGIAQGWEECYTAQKSNLPLVYTTLRNLIKDYSTENITQAKEVLKQGGKKTKRFFTSDEIVTIMRYSYLFGKFAGSADKKIVTPHHSNEIMSNFNHGLRVSSIPDSPIVRRFVNRYLRHIKENYRVDNFSIMEMLGRRMRN